MNAMLAQTRIELKLFSRDIMQMFFTFILPAALFILFGMLFGDVSYDGVPYFEKYIPAMISIIILNTTLFTLGVQMVTDREKGVLRRLRGTPLKPWMMFFGVSLKGLFAVIVGAIEIIVLAYLIFNITPSPYLLTEFLIITFTYICFSSIGFLITSVSSKIGVSLGIAFILMYIMMFLSGTTLPLTQLPPVITTISNYIPLTHVHQLLELSWRGEALSGGLLSFGVLIGMFIVCIFLSSKFFKWE